MAPSDFNQIRNSAGNLPMYSIKGSLFSSPGPSGPSCPDQRSAASTRRERNRTPDLSPFPPLFFSSTRRERNRTPDLAPFPPFLTISLEFRYTFSNISVLCVVPLPPMKPLLSDQGRLRQCGSRGRLHGERFPPGGSGPPRGLGPAPGAERRPPREARHLVGCAPLPGRLQAVGTAITSPPLSCLLFLAPGISGRLGYLADSRSPPAQKYRHFVSAGTTRCVDNGNYFLDLVEVEVFNSKGEMLPLQFCGTSACASPQQV